MSLLVNVPLLLVVVKRGAQGLTDCLKCRHGIQQNDIQHNDT